jgi:hypothetical protein
VQLVWMQYHWAWQQLLTEHPWGWPQLVRPCWALQLLAQQLPAKGRRERRWRAQQQQRATLRSLQRVCGGMAWKEVELVQVLRTPQHPHPERRQRTLHDQL